MNFKRLAETLVVALTCSAAQVQSAPPPAPSIAPLPVLLALKAAKVALATCIAGGFTPTVTVTDREGVARVVLVADGAEQVSIIASRRKAYTAAALGISTAQLAKKLAVSGMELPIIDPGLIAFGGGFPILRHNVVIGAIAVGGADRGTSDEPNETCAQAGLNAIKKQLD